MELKGTCLGKEYRLFLSTVYDTKLFTVVSTLPIGNHTIVCDRKIPTRLQSKKVNADEQSNTYLCLQIIFSWNLVSSYSCFYF